MKMQNIQTYPNTLIYYVNAEMFCVTKFLDKPSVKNH